MKDLHDVIMFPFNGEKTLGVVLKHYTDPLNDFYVIYADHCLYEYISDDCCNVLSYDAIMPECDAAMTDYRLKRQHLDDIARCHEAVGSLMDAMRHMDMDDFP